MAVDTGEQGQEFCRILVLTDENTGTQNAECGSQLESRTCVGASVNCHKPADVMGDCPQPFSSPCLIPEDIETGATNVVSNIGQETGGGMKNEIALTKPLRRQNSLQTGGEPIPPLMNHILMLLKLDPKEKQAIERVHDAAHNRWRKYKRVASFDSRRIVLLFSVLSSMGTIVLIFLTLRVRQVSDGYVHG